MLKLWDNNGIINPYKRRISMPRIIPIKDKKIHLKFQNYVIYQKNQFILQRMVMVIW